MLLREKHSRVLMINMSLLRNILKSQDILKFKFLVISLVTMFILTKEIVQFKEDIKRLLRKPHLKFHLKLERLLVKLPSKLLELLDISMLVLLNSSLILRLISFTLWKWILDFKLSIQLQKWLLGLILLNGNSELQVDSPFQLLNNKIFLSSVTLLKLESMLKTQIMDSYQVVDILRF